MQPHIFNILFEYFICLFEPAPFSPCLHHHQNSFLDSQSMWNLRNWISWSYKYKQIHCYILNIYLSISDFWLNLPHSALAPTIAKIYFWTATACETWEIECHEVTSTNRYSPIFLIFIWAFNSFDWTCLIQPFLAPSPKFISRLPEYVRSDKLSAMKLKAQTDTAPYF